MPIAPDIPQYLSHLFKRNVLVLFWRDQANPIDGLDHVEVSVGSLRFAILFEYSKHVALPSKRFPTLLSRHGSDYLSEVANRINGNCMNMIDAWCKYKISKLVRVIVAGAFIKCSLKESV